MYSSKYKKIAATVILLLIFTASFIKVNVILPYLPTSFSKINSKISSKLNFTDNRYLEPQTINFTYFENEMGLKREKPKTLVHFILLYDKIPLKALCSIESLVTATKNRYETALRNNGTEKDIIVWVKNRIELPFTIASEGFSVKQVIFPGLDNIFFSTPFENFHFDGTFKNQNIANALRLAIVYKYGGLYLDADMLSFQDPLILGEGIGEQFFEPGKFNFNNAAFRFDKPKDKMILKFMKNFVEKYNGNFWGNQGPGMFSRVLKANCEKEQPPNLNLNCFKENGKYTKKIKIWHTKDVYPIDFYHIDKFIGAKSFAEIGFPNLVLLHLWNKLFKKKEIKICKKSIDKYSKSAIGLARSNLCPAIFDNMKFNCLE